MAFGKKTALLNKHICRWPEFYLHSPASPLTSTQTHTHTHTLWLWPNSTFALSSLASFSGYCQSWPVSAGCSNSLLGLHCLYCPFIHPSSPFLPCAMLNWTRTGFNSSYSATVMPALVSTFPVYWNLTNWTHGIPVCFERVSREYKDYNVLKH